MRKETVTYITEIETSDILATWLGLTAVALTIVVLTSLLALDVWLWRKALA